MTTPRLRRPSLFASLRSRRRADELMDAPDVDPDDLRKSLHFLTLVNRRLKYGQSVLHHLEAFARDWPAGRTMTVLDVATGSGDISRQIVDWSRRRNLDVRVVGLDRHAEVARMAAEACRAEPISIVRGDALALPFGDGAFDYVMTSTFLHHLDDDVVVDAIREMDRVARRGLIVADLVRSRRALAWIKLFTLFGNPVLYHDSAVSVAQSFRRAEIESLAGRAGAGYVTYHEHFGHRFVLAGQKGEGSP